MTVVEWLRGRSPGAPRELFERVERALGDQGAGEGSAEAATETCLAAAERLLGELLGRDAATREQALDLLAVDALVTYAFEAASDIPEGLASRADRALARLAALGAAEGTEARTAERQGA